MIRQVLLCTNFKKQLYKNKLVCGCVYRSFSDLEAGVFFRFCMNNGRLTNHQINQIFLPHNYDKIRSIIQTFKSLQILKNVDMSTLQLSADFSSNIQQFVKQPLILQPVSLPSKPSPYQPKPFQFLQILFQDKLPRKCKLSAVSPYATHLTKQQFIYIKSDISYKISVLIEGIINGKDAENLRNIQNLVLMNLLDADQYYLRNDKLNPIIDQLSRIKLVQLARENGQYFRISRYLENFMFKSAKQRQINTKLNCRIIIQTNFKVFAVIKSAQPRQNKVIKKILSMLLKSQKQGVQYQQLFIGQINMQFMKTKIFQQTGIKTSQYFDFFKQYTDTDDKNQNQNQGNQGQNQNQNQNHKEKDLGKWKKLKFIGLQGPSQESNIPSNIRQEVKLWEHLKDYNL